MFQYNKGSGSPFGFVISLVIFSLIIYGLFTVASWLFQILWSIGPFLIIAAFFINKNVVLNYGKWLVELLKHRTLFGVGMVALSIFAFPALSVFLFVKSLLANKVKNVLNDIETGGFGDPKSSGGFTEYEEVDSKPKNNDSSILDLEDFGRLKKPKESSNNENQSSDYL